MTRTGGGLLLAGALMLAACQEPMQSTDETGTGEGVNDVAGAEPDATTAPLRLTSVSTQPWLVSGGDVLLRVTQAAGDNAGRELLDLRVTVNGLDVSADFRPDPAGDGLLGLLQGLPEGESLVEAQLPDGGSAHLRLQNHPISGPMISGPHQSPYFCQTEQFRLVTGALLTAALDEFCSTPTRVDYVYFSEAAQEFLPYPPDEAALNDIAATETLSGRQVPFIVRVETGTVNRAIYESALLHDPAQPAPDPWNRSVGWNGKLVYTHGGGCRGGWFRQGSQTGGVLNEGLLRMGFAVTSSTLNVFGQNCNDLLASETHIMVKERFVEHYGEPVYTIATGASGGSYQSHQTADNFPGVFDGIIVSASFPDVTSATIFTLADARLLHRLFSQTDLFTQEQQLAISGFGQWGSIPNLSQGAARLDPTWEAEAAPEHQGGELRLPALVAMRYSEQQPDGVRATVYDHTRNVYGTDAQGRARRPLDNRGVQYGLQTLSAGLITPAQFVALNRDIGGFDADLNHIPERHQADPVATRHAFGSGRILWGGAGLSQTPIIDYRSYTDNVESGDIHMKVHQHSTRARLLAANGHAENHVMAVGGRWGFTEERPDLGVLFRQMDAWLSAIEADRIERDPVARMLRHRPAALTDHCWDNRVEPRVRIVEPQQVGGAGLCSELYPAFPTPRHIAGAPLANDIVSCRLKPLNPDDYIVAFSDQQWSALETIFPEGVCDWDAGDLHRGPYYGTWQSFGPSAMNLVE